MNPQEARMALSQMPQGGLSPQEAQAALSMLPANQSSQPQNQRGLLDETARKTLATLGTFGKNIINLPSNLSAGFIPPGIDSNYDYYKNLGVGENIGDKIAVGALEYALPGMAANKLVQGGKFLSKALKSNVLGGAAYGAIKDEENRLGGAALGAASGAAGYGVAKGISAAGKPVGNYLTERIAKPLTEKAAKLINYEKLAPWERTQNAMRQTYSAVEEAEKNLWKRNQQANRTADKAAKEGLREWGATPSQRFDKAERLVNSRGYTRSRGLTDKSVNSYATDLWRGIEPASGDVLNQFKPNSIITSARRALSPLLKESKGNPNLQQVYKPTIDNLRNMAKNPPRTYEEAAARLKDLNASMKVAQQTFGTKDLLLNRSVSNLKSALKNDIRSSSASTLVSKPSKTLEAANKATIAKQNLSSMPQTPGTTKQNREVREFFANPNKADEGVLSNFLPKKGQTSAERMKSLAKIIGNEGLAKEALQRYALRNSFNNGVPDLNNLLKTYQSFSPAQRNYLFTKEQNSYLQNAAKADVMKQNHGGQNFKEWYLNHKLFGAGGALADLIGGKQAAKLFANPRGAERVMNWAENGFFKPSGHTGAQLFKPHEEQQ